MNTAYQDAVALCDAGRFGEAETRTREWLTENPGDPRGRTFLNRLMFLQAKVGTPPDAKTAMDLAQHLAELRGPPALQGADEGPRLQRAVELVQHALPALPDAARPVAAHILWRTGHYADAAAVGGLQDIGRNAAAHGAGRTLLRQLARVETDADRLELIRQHQLWAEQFEAAAAADPITRPPRRSRPERLRLGFLSSDLRHHVVAFFAQPLFQFMDMRFELFVYSSFPGPPDVMQPYFAARSTYRQLPSDDREAAEIIAHDDLDMLIEMGGPTLHARPGVLAYRPAVRQASWMGYPHSLGLSAIDYYLADHHVLPPRREFLLEQPLAMPACWICMAPSAFTANPAVEPDPPVTRAGHITFGTANDPYKYSPKVLGTWARVLARVPGSRFMIIRPEAGAASFRENIGRVFAEAGVDPARLDFRATRGGIRPIYNQMDIALDTFPLTGGTTTCEALWMGVPTVTLVGEAPYERLSWSILSNAGLPELATTSLDAYVDTAVALAADVPRLSALRSGMRARIEAHPLGQPMQFAADFYELIAETIAGRGQAS